MRWTGLEMNWPYISYISIDIRKRGHKMKYDIFISYRRDGGEYTAKILKDRLDDLGYSVFFDVEALRSGDFNTKLYSVIEECTDFVVVLSPNSLERCKNKDDWVRLEIEHALMYEKNIIPVLLRGFQFPEELPPSVDPIRYKSGIEANSEFFDAFIDKLQIFLKSKKTLFRRLTQNIIFKRTWPVFMALVLLAGIGVGGNSLYKMRQNTYPKNQVERNLTGEVMMDLQNYLVVANEMIGELEETYEACDSYLTNKDETSYQNAVSVIERTRKSIEEMDFSKKAISQDTLEKLDRSPFNKADWTSFNTYIVKMKENFLSGLDCLEVYINPETMLDMSVRQKLLEAYNDELGLFRMDLVYTTNGLLLPIDTEYKGMVDFKRSILPALTQLPFEQYTWLSSEEEIDNVMRKITAQYEELVTKRSALVGNMNVAYMSEKGEFVKMLMSVGMSREEAEDYLARTGNKMENIEALKKQVEEEIQELEEIRNKAKVKFAPQSADDCNLLWGKMLRFLTLDMSDEAVSCAQAYLVKARNSKEEPYVGAATYIPIVIQYIKQISQTGVDFGVMVVGMDAKKQEETVYQIGDVIIAINDSPCRTYKDIEKLTHEEGENKVSIMRLNAQQQFEYPVYNIEGKVIRGLWVQDMTETE